MGQYSLPSYDQSTVITSPKGCDQEYIKCLSRLFSLSPSFSTPAEIHGGSSSIEVDQELKAWCKALVSPIIYVYGKPGVGKSVFSSFLLRTLPTIPNADPERLSITYYSFSELDQRRTSTTALLSSLICQIISQDPGDFEQIRDLYLAIERRSSWTSEALWILYQSLLAARRGGIHLFLHHQQCSQLRHVPNTISGSFGKCATDQALGNVIKSNPHRRATARYSRLFEDLPHYSLRQPGGSQEIDQGSHR